MVGSFCELVYDNFVRLYGIEFLNINTDIGGDKDIEPEEKEYEEGVDSEGDEK